MYFGLYNVLSRMGNDAVFTDLEIRSCVVIKFTKTAVQDGLVTYDFKTGSVTGLEEDA